MNSLTIEAYRYLYRPRGGINSYRFEASLVLYYYVYYFPLNHTEYCSVLLWICNFGVFALGFLECTYNKSHLLNCTDETISIITSRDNGGRISQLIYATTVKILKKVCFESGRVHIFKKFTKSTKIFDRSMRPIGEWDLTRIRPSFKPRNWLWLYIYIYIYLNPLNIY